MIYTIKTTIDIDLRFHAEVLMGEIAATTNELLSQRYPDTKKRIRHFLSMEEEEDEEGEVDAEDILGEE